MANDFHWVWGRRWVFRGLGEEPTAETDEERIHRVMVEDPEAFRIMQENFLGMLKAADS